MASRIFGSGIKRREDPRLLTGQGKFTDDFVLPGMAHMAVVRSPYAHARIKKMDATRARSLPGVLGVFTGQDMKDAGFGGIPCAWVVPNSDTQDPRLPPDRDRHRPLRGERGGDRGRGRPLPGPDGADAVEVDYEPLPVVVDPWKAAQQGAPTLHDGRPRQRLLPLEGERRRHRGARSRRRRSWSRSASVNQRLIPNAIEPRAALAQYVSASDEVTLWVTTQNPHIVRFLLSLDTGIPEHRIRVIAPEVGGGFGSKIPHYPEDAMVIFASKTLGRPVKWTETRSENYKSTIHGRDHVQEVELAAKKDGTITGLRARVWANLGAYLSTAATGIPTILHGLMLSGAYNIPNIHEDVYGMMTNTTPVDAYRGAGRPEATFIVERLVDLLAAEVKMDPVDVRRKNFIPPFKDGHTVATGIVYDTGNYDGALDKLLQMSDYAGLRKKQADLGPRASTSGSASAPTPRSAVSGPPRWQERWASGADSGRAPSCASTPRARSTCWSGSPRTARARRRPSPRSWRASWGWPSRTWS